MRDITNGPDVLLLEHSLLRRGASAGNAVEFTIKKGSYEGVMEARVEGMLREDGSGLSFILIIQVMGRQNLWYAAYYSARTRRGKIHPISR